MAPKTITAMTDLQAATRKLISAHEAVREGIATHVEKRRALLQAMRHEAEMQAAINAGAERNNASLRSDRY